MPVLGFFKMGRKVDNTWNFPLGSTEITESTKDTLVGDKQRSHQGN